jgi:HPr kinase/phosphorylase
VTGDLTPDSQILHASCVALDRRGLLILGPSGSGKSALAIRLIALGATLVADDRTLLTVADGRLIASCPSSTIAGLIEARGIGLLRVPAAGATEIALVADLAQIETERLPPLRRITILGCDLALVLQSQNDHFPDALMLYLRHGRQA